jgi:ribosomal-protein-alanine N-acetyltransferase
MPFDLRQATLDDLPRLLALEERSFDRPWPEGAFAQELELPHAEVWMASADGAVVGYIDFWIVGPEVSLLNVAVDPDWRRQGLAKQLLDLLDRRAREVEAEAIFLEVRRGNEGARALYAREGFEPIGIRKGYYSDNGEDAIVMSRGVVGRTP